MNLPRVTSLLAFLLTALPAWPAIPAGMVLEWADEFDYAGAPDPARWTHETGAGGWGNNELQTYTDKLENSRVEDGRLIIEALQFTDSRTPYYTSARLVTRDKGEWKYGRIEVRAKLPSETGTWSAIWMLAAEQVYGDAYWPDNGEIDIVEHVGYEEDPLFLQVKGVEQLDNVHGTLHTYTRNGRDNQGLGGRTYGADVSTEYHVYAVNWYEDRIEFEFDGLNYNTIFRDDLIPVRNPPEDPWQYWPFKENFFLILNIAVGGNWGGHFNSGYYPSDSPYGSNGVDDDGTWPQRLEVDYVRVYSLGDGTWKGLPVDEAGNAPTDSWMGTINVSAAPWIYSYQMDRFFLPQAALEDTFHTGGQWVYFPRP